MLKKTQYFWTEFGEGLHFDAKKTWTVDIFSMFNGKFLIV